ncbi:hypothetical protein NCCP691_27280 [Noviherbaspirillum aridicola]|uniref:Peptidase M1 membrane alanine aminopeptidase domain-containing protein n=2 Tax=Noviherbaspirillum aridicola TaxID=2849687 RepID=A0ABQ4Q7M9_9BURK|nr:hypothetical protein NCCP691_27280 [Noviherbaspirillum aridicola]
MRRWLLRLSLWLLLAPGAAFALPLLELDVKLDPDRRRLEASASLPVSGPAFRFVLHPSLAVQRAEIDGKALRVRPGNSANDLREWRIELPSAGGRLRVDYAGELPPLDRQRDHRGVLTAMPPMASAEGSFLPAYGGWYPHPGQAHSYRVHLSLPASQRGLVPGNLLSESLPSAADARYRASIDFPHASDGIELMAGPWIMREKRHRLPGGEEVAVRTLFDAELDATPGLSEGYLEDAARYLSRYSAHIGPYPWRGFSIVAAPLPTGFGMPALTYIGRDVLKLPFIRATSLGHEVLHNWWGNGVRIDPAQGNWSEGLTTFMADYAYREDASPQAAYEMRLSWLRDAAAVPAAERKPLSAFRYRTHAAGASLGYGKAAMLFLMLRDDIGEQAFARGIRLFWERQRFRAASWDDLRSAFEQASGRSLDGFFAQWLQRADGPRVRIAAARSVAGGTEVTLEQEGQPYDLRLPLQLQREEGKAGMAGIELHVVRFGERRRSFLLKSPADAVRLDPDLRVWRELDAAQLPPIWRQWIAARAPRLVVLSADGRTAEAARALAAALFENPPKEADLSGLREGREPVLLVGLHAEVDQALARTGLPARPADPGTRGSAQAWTIPGIAGAPVAVVSAADAEALAALSGPLPHYGGQSWLAFEGRRAIARGAWPALMPAVPVRP